MSQLPFVVGGSGLIIGTTAASGNVQFDNTTGNLIVGNSSTGVGNLIVNGNSLSNNNFAMSVANGGMSILGNLYINGLTGLHATMTSVATISVGDIFFTLTSGGSAFVPVGTVITQSSGSPLIAAGTGTVPDGTYKCLGLFQTTQYRGMYVRIT